LQLSAEAPRRPLGDPAVRLSHGQTVVPFHGRAELDYHDLPPGQSTGRGQLLRASGCIHGLGKTVEMSVFSPSVFAKKSPDGRQFGKLGFDGVGCSEYRSFLVSELDVGKCNVYCCGSGTLASLKE
jgi:hypothetical protein